MSKRKHSKESKATLNNVYARLRECLDAVKPSNQRLSGAMRSRLNYNLEFLSVFIQLQGDIYTDVQAIGFYDDSECDEDYEDEDGTYEEYGGKA